MRGAPNRKNRIIFALLIASALVAALFNFSPASYKWFRETFYPNKIIVEPGPGLSQQNVSIIWCDEIMNCDTIYNHGSRTNKQFLKEGKNTFQVYYADSLITIFSHLKSGYTTGVSYTFKIDKVFSRINAEVVVNE